MLFGKSPALKMLLVIIGAGGILGQLLLLRELLVIYNGNELIIGIILSNWLVFEAAGAYQGRKCAPVVAGTIYPALFMLYPVVLLCSIYAVRGMNYHLFKLVPGESAPLTVIILASLLALAFAGYIHGLLFPLTCRLLNSAVQPDSNVAGGAYIIETLGTLIGGVLFTFYLANRFDPFEITINIFFAHLLGSAILFKSLYKNTYKSNVAVFFTVCVLVAGIYTAPGFSQSLQKVSLQRQWPGRIIVHYENTAYGNIVITEDIEEYTFYQDGRPSLTYPNPDWLTLEDIAHLALAAHSAPRNILVVGAGVGGLLEQLLKHPVDSVDYVEIDPRLLELYDQYLPDQAQKELHNDKVRVINADLRYYLVTTENKYDIIMITFFQPDTLQANRLFTEEFFRLVEKALDNEGLFFFSAPGAPLKYTADLLPLNATLLKTVSTVFSDVEILPGDLTYFYASNDEIELNEQKLFSRLVERGLEDGLISADYLKRRFDPLRVEVNRDLIKKKGSGTNRDYHPAALYDALLTSGNYYSPLLFNVLRKLENLYLLWFVALLPLLAGLIYLKLFNKRARPACHYAVFSTGLSGMAFNLLILYAFQALYGIVYQAIGLFFMVFMGGILLGGMLGVRVSCGNKAVKGFFKSELLVLLMHPLIFAAALFLQFLAGKIDQTFVAVLFLFFGSLSGLSVGYQFPLAAGLANNQSQAAGSLYAADLLGGWLGGIIISVILYPLIGLGGTLLVVGLIKASSLTLYNHSHDQNDSTCGTHWPG
jgi:spermidine synthase